MRRSGVLLHVSSLPSPYGIGTLGHNAYEFIDYLDKAGQSIWQMLPLNPTGMGDSPYSTWSTRAANPYFIDLDKLNYQGLLWQGEFEHIDWGDNPESVDYGKLYNNRLNVLRKAVARMDPKKIRDYLEENPWIKEHALYMILKEKNKMAPWYEWDEEEKHPTPAKLKKLEKDYEDELMFWTGIQMLFDEQYGYLKKYANEKGIKIMGDIPFYVSHDSADVWAHQDLFQLNKDGSLKAVSGCPGQIWGNPLHDWKAQKKDGYKWWMDRLEQSSKMYDILRLDHFIGFDSFYAVDPVTEEGEWQKGPGMELLKKIKALGKEVVAEDLGDRTKSMAALLEESKIPGMMILEYAFNDRLQEKSLYIPYNHPKNSVAYTGTHDNPSITLWMQEMKPDDLKFAKDFIHSYGNDEQFNWDMIRTLQSSLAETVIMQAQDLKALPVQMNKPGEAWGNWTWRLKPNALDEENARWVAKITDTYGRLKKDEEEDEECETEENIAEAEKDKKAKKA